MDKENFDLSLSAAGRNISFAGARKTAPIGVCAEKTCRSCGR